MESTRLSKVSRLIQKDLGEIFQRESRTLFGGAFITVTGVRVSADLGVAKVYLSLYMVKDKDATMKNIKDQASEVRKRLGLRVGKQMRVVPSLEFFLDDSIDHAMRIDELLKK